MSTRIEDGTGNGQFAKVDAEKRLHTHAFGVTMIEAAALKGESFTVGTGLIELADTSDSAIFYIKNNSDDDFFIYEQNILIGPSTGGAIDLATITFHGLITGGTIVSDDINTPAVNARIQSSNILVADTLVGGQGKTIISGSQVSFATQTVTARGPIVLPSGQTIGISIQPPAGNTSQLVSYGLSLINEASKFGND